MLVEWVNPWVFIFLPLPIVVYLFAPAHRQQKNAVKVPFFRTIIELSGKRARRGAVLGAQSLAYLFLCFMVWLALLMAAAKPQQLGDAVHVEKSARDLMVAVDLSASMEARDFQSENSEAVTRLQAVKSVLAGFVKQRPHDRLGLIVFGDSAFLQAPFTQDHETWLTLLNETEIGMAGSSTALGDSIGLAIKLFRNNDSNNRVLIVLTDGSDTGSRVPPIDAAKVAKQYGVTIYSIAIGSLKTGGEEALDVEALKRIASETGGDYYHAINRESLSDIYQQISSLEPEVFDALSYRPRHDVFYIPLSAALVFLLLALSLLAIQQNRAEHND